MSKGLEQCDKCDYFISVEEAYNQGRADAIDEFAIWCYECNVKFDDTGYRTAKDTVKEFLESKEQK